MRQTLPSGRHPYVFLLSFKISLISLSISGCPCRIFIVVLSAKVFVDALHYGKVVKTGFEMVNFDELFLCQFSTKMNQILMDGI